jgi:AAA+ ATPase superfamily predicted ATPase
VGVEDAEQLARFFDNPIGRPTLGLMYGRRRIGKSTLLVHEVQARKGFYFEATRVETPVQLERLGKALGEYLGVPPLALPSWDEAIRALLHVVDDGPVPVVIDEFGHILEADRSVDSIVANAFGPGARRSTSGQARLVLCGSAIAMMRALTNGEAPLRGRAGMELVVHPDDFRVAADRLPPPGDLNVAVRVFAVIGGVVGYATEMVDFDLPATPDDVDRWVIQRVLSPGATLHREATTLLAEDPTLSGAGSLLHHSILGAIANGSVTAGAIANKVGKQVSNLNPALNRLIEAGFVSRYEDPIRAKRPLYALGDPFLQFHYAVLEPFGAALRDRPAAAEWKGRLKAVFGSQVRGPVFEQQAHTWVRRFASDETLPVRDHVGRSSVPWEGKDLELDVVVAGPGDVPGERTVLALGEAKAGETLSQRHVRRLELARSALGVKAAQAKLLLFGTAFDEGLVEQCRLRHDVELVGLERLYRGA